MDCNGRSYRVKYGRHAEEDMQYNCYGLNMLSGKKNSLKSKSLIKENKCIMYFGVQ